jgi:hypothetical protein
MKKTDCIRQSRMIVGGKMVFLSAAGTTLRPEQSHDPRRVYALFFLVPSKMTIMHPNGDPLS